jgi:hypothetical protein
MHGPTDPERTKEYVNKNEKSCGVRAAGLEQRMEIKLPASIFIFCPFLGAT